MIDWADTMPVSIGAVTLELPSAVVTGSDAPIDSAAGVFRGGGLTVIVDQGPFADRLDRHAGRPEYRVEAARVAGRAARLVSYREAGIAILGVHLPPPDSVTVVVQADAAVPEDVSRRIIESLQLRR